MKTWGFENLGLWADTEKGILGYVTKLVLSVSVANDQPKILYEGKWEKHFNHAEWTDMVGTNQAKLSRGGGKEKGPGKGAKAAPE